VAVAVGGVAPPLELVAAAMRPLLCVAVGEAPLPPLGVALLQPPLPPPPLLPPSLVAAEVRYPPHRLRWMRRRTSPPSCRTWLQL